ncbi:MAG: hypothetical protein H7Y22_13100 [Gemmatimonadaceae bacterium]|nr:hypothetical protein [Gloeobacterales cyanobacterium ES-bin-141]
MTLLHQLRGQVLLAHDGNLFNHIAQGEYDNILTTPLDWFVFGMMLVFLAASALFVVRFIRTGRLGR